MTDGLPHRIDRCIMNPFGQLAVFATATAGLAASMLVNLGLQSA